MELFKGNLIKVTKTNAKYPEINSELIYEVKRVNKKTYGLICVEGYLKGVQCNLLKNFKEIYTDEYGTITKRVLVA